MVLTKTTPVVLYYCCVHLPSPTPLERTPSSERLTVLVVPTSTVRRPTGAVSASTTPRANEIDAPSPNFKIGVIILFVCVVYVVFNIVIDLLLCFECDEHKQL